MPRYSWYFVLRQVTCVILSNQLLIMLIYGQTFFLIRHRSTTHRLTVYPGPFCAKIINWRAAYYVWIGDSHIESWNVHSEFVRMSPNIILTNTITALREIHGNNKNLRNFAAYAMLR